MLRWIFRTIFKAIQVLLLLAIAVGIYSYFRTGRIPFVHEAMEDAAMAASVKAAMAVRRDLGSRAIRVEARSGNVILRGTVGAEEEKREATSIAESVVGVRSVENLLEVTDSPMESAFHSLGQTLDDAAVLARIRAALSLDRQTKTLPLEISVHEGTAVIEGAVASDELRARVVERVRAVEGVVAVDDRLTKN